MGAGVGLSDSVIWFTSSFLETMVGAGTGSLSSSLVVFHEFNDTVCSILGAPELWSMAEIEHLA